MNVRTLCLAILSFGDATGYEIRKHSVEGNFSYFVDASFGAIYPALNRLTEDGLVTVRDELQAGKPARRVYSITPEGRRALMDALMQEPGLDSFKSPFLLVAMFASVLPREHVTRAIDCREAALERTLSSLSECLGEVKGCGAGGSEWILRYGIAVHQASLDHLRVNRAELEAVAGSRRVEREAAE
ncbi:PadR family transcriptional regulator [Lutibaculum baratangense]|uniref:Transcriptional regulator, PadR family n=1 Tax=Lutibaculum baratangense AMV1 TaxID=631454 RepID=V4REN8_9HYPH|nr:PadR family transcriptional regulator [Lutibaculum baratangense]ESR24606.1 Transcriptional regulator, PadR family [Lutibaculum baratangense AMV1]